MRFTTALPEEEAIKKIREAIKVRIAYRIDEDEGTFQLRATDIPKSSFYPTFYGNIKSENGETVLEGEFRTPTKVKVTAAIAVGWFLFSEIRNIYQHFTGQDQYTLLGFFFFLLVLSAFVFVTIDGKKRAAEEKDKIIRYLKNCFELDISSLD